MVLSEPSLPISVSLLLCLVAWCACVVWVSLYHSYRTAGRDKRQCVAPDLGIPEKGRGNANKVLRRSGLNSRQKEKEKKIQTPAELSKEARCGRVIWRRWYSRQGTLEPSRREASRREPHGLEAQVRPRPVSGGGHGDAEGRLLLVVVRRRRGAVGRDAGARVGVVRK